MKKMTCIRCVLQVNVAQKRYLQYHMQETHRMYEDISTRLKSGKTYTKKEIKGMIKIYHRDYLMQMEEKEVEDFVISLMRVTKIKQVGYRKRNHNYECIITNKALFYRGLNLHRYLKYPYYGDLNHFYFARLKQVNHQFMLLIYVRKFYKNDEKAG